MPFHTIVSPSAATFATINSNTISDALRHKSAHTIVTERIIIVFLSLSKTILGLLFHRVMLLSGTGLSPWSLVSDPARYAAIISHHVNCSPDLSYSQLLKCLREQPLNVLLSTPIGQPDFGNAFGPSVDGVVIGKFEFALCLAEMIQWTALLTKRNEKNNNYKRLANKSIKNLLQMSAKKREKNRNRYRSTLIQIESFRLDSNTEEHLQRKTDGK